MRRETQNLLLVLLGGALLKLSLTGDFLRYVKQAHQPWLIAAGVVMLLLATVAIVRDLRAATPGESCHGDGEHEHSTRSSWMLLLPVLAVLFVAPPALGADSAARAVDQVRAAPSEPPAYPPLPEGKASPMSISEFHGRARWDESESLRDRTVSLTGFVSRKGEEVYLTRMVIGCCAADAYPVKVRLDRRAAAGYSDDDWVTVNGRLVVETAQDTAPALATVSIRAAEEPAEPYE